MSSVWNADVAQAIAQHISMPGLESYQQQYVRYGGQTEATKVDEGWEIRESEAAWRKQFGLHGPEFNGASSMPRQVQLSITAAPAEFCLPMKNDRQFKPHFQVQVRVVHAGQLHLPLRLKAFAIIHDDMQQITEWLPDELKNSEEERRSRMIVDLKGGTVVSYVFQTSTSASGQPTVTQVPQMASSNGRVHNSDAPLNFPSKLSRPCPDRPLRQSDSIRSQEDDPEMATPLKLGGVCNTVVAQYEFKSLEFARPTRMNPTYMVFACLVADQDLLFVTYQVPCISICRAEQRAKALERLGMPTTVYADITAAGGTPPTVVGHPERQQRGGAAPNVSAGAGAPAAGGEAEAMEGKRIMTLVETWGQVIDKDGASAGHGSGSGMGSFPEASSMPTLLSEFSFPGQDSFNIAQLDIPLPSLPIGTSTVDAMSCLPTEEAKQTQELENDLRNNTNSVLQSVGTMPGGGGLNDMMAIMQRSALAGPSSGTTHSAHTANLYNGSGDAGPSGSRGVGGDPNSHFPDPHGYNKRRHRGPEDNAQDFGGIEPMQAAPGRSLRPWGGAGGGVDAGGRSGRVSDSASAGSGFVNAWMESAPTPSSVDDGSNGVTQLEAYNWTIEEYAHTGLQRQLQRQDYQALLSLAGFPLMAGLDHHARVGRRQFAEFQTQFQGALTMLRSISQLWNRQDPCVVSGFDMDRRHAVSALANQPYGTFICRFSMNQSGCLVLSCKVKPGTQDADGDIMHITVSMNDLANRRIEQVILNVPYASHVLDVYTNRRVDKRTLLQSGYMRVNRIYDPVEQSAMDHAAAAATSSMSRSMG